MDATWKKKIAYDFHPETIYTENSSSYYDEPNQEQKGQRRYTGAVEIREDLTTSKHYSKHTVHSYSALIECKHWKVQKTDKSSSFRGKVWKYMFRLLFAYSAISSCCLERVLVLIL
jgi:hypothetical protein